MEIDTTITISVEVTNTGDVKGEEIVQLYIQDVVGEVVRPIKELKGFKKVMLHPGETRTISFTLQRNNYVIIIVIYNIKVIRVHLLLISVRTVMMFKLYPLI